MMQVGFRQVNGPSYAVAIRQSTHAKNITEQRTPTDCVFAFP